MTWFRKYSRRVSGLVALASLVALLCLPVPGCGGGGGDENRPDARKHLSEVLEQGIRPNEMGMVMILEYHRVEQQEGDYIRSVENFRKDLQTLYDSGYRLVSFSDMMEGIIDVPAGTTPVVLTYDDSTISQFRYIERDGELIIDPDCAIGMMKDFHEQHPDFGYTALFNFLPNFFEQPEYAQQKADYLLEHGSEFGNHTDSHPALGNLSDGEVQREIALPEKHLSELLPDYEMNVLCLPFGSLAKNEDLMFSGSYEGISYDYDYALLVGSNPMYMHYHYRGPGRLVPRIQMMDYNPDTGYGVNGSAYWLDFFEKRPELRYISDGNKHTICAPAYMEPRLEPDMIPDGVDFIGY